MCTILCPAREVYQNSYSHSRRLSQIEGNDATERAAVYMSEMLYFSRGTDYAYHIVYGYLRVVDYIF